MSGVHTWLAKPEDQVRAYWEGIEIGLISFEDNGGEHTVLTGAQPHASLIT